MSLALRFLFFSLFFCLPGTSYAHDDGKVQKMIDYAAELTEDRVFYRWQSKKSGENLIGAKTYSDSLYNYFMGMTLDDQHFAAGHGIYVSENLFSGSSFIRGDDEGSLVEVRVKKGTRFLDLTGRRFFMDSTIFKRAGFDKSDVYSLNPPLVTKYNNEKSWWVIKGQSGVSFKPFDPSLFEPLELGKQIDKAVKTGGIKISRIFYRRLSEVDFDYRKVLLDNIDALKINFFTNSGEEFISEAIVHHLRNAKTPQDLYKIIEAVNNGSVLWGLIPLRDNLLESKDAMELILGKTLKFEAYDTAALLMGLYRFNDVEIPEGLKVLMRHSDLKVSFLSAKEIIDSYLAIADIDIKKKFVDRTKDRLKEEILLSPSGLFRKEITNFFSDDEISDIMRSLFQSLEYDDLDYFIKGIHNSEDLMRIFSTREDLFLNVLNKLFERKDDEAISFVVKLLDKSHRRGFVEQVLSLVTDYYKDQDLDLSRIDRILTHLRKEFDGFVDFSILQEIWIDHLYKDSNNIFAKETRSSLSSDELKKLIDHHWFSSGKEGDHSNIIAFIRNMTYDFEGGADEEFAKILSDRFRKDVSGHIMEMKSKDIYIAGAMLLNEENQNIVLLRLLELEASDRELMGFLDNARRLNEHSFYHRVSEMMEVILRNQQSAEDFIRILKLSIRVFPADGLFDLVKKDDLEIFQSLDPEPKHMDELRDFFKAHGQSLDGPVMKVEESGRCLLRKFKLLLDGLGET